MDNIFSSSLTVLYVDGISLKTSIAEAVYLTEQLAKRTRYSDIIISKKNIIFLKHCCILIRL